MSVDFEFVRPVLAGMLGAAATGFLATRSARMSPDRAGWLRIEPALMHWTVLFGAAGFAVLLAYVRLFVGSARADADGQLLALNGLIAASVLGTLVSLRQIRLIRQGNVFWRDATLCFTSPGGAERLLAMTEIIDIRQIWTGWLLLECRDGTVIRLDPYAKGADALCSRIAEVSLARMDRQQARGW